MNHHFNDRSCGSCRHFSGGRTNHQNRWVECSPNEYGICGLSGCRTCSNSSCSKYQSR